MPRPTPPTPAPTNPNFKSIPLFWANGGASQRIGKGPLGTFDYFYEPPAIYSQAQGINRYPQTARFWQGAYSANGATIVCTLPATLLSPATTTTHWGAISDTPLFEIDMTGMVGGIEAVGFDVDYYTLEVVTSYNVEGYLIACATSSSPPVYESYKNSSQFYVNGFPVDVAHDPLYQTGPSVGYYQDFESGNPPVPTLWQYLLQGEWVESNFDYWATEPLDLSTTDPAGIRTGYRLNNYGSYDYLLKPAASIWPGQDSTNEANRLLWTAEELRSAVVSFSMKGTWGKISQGQTAFEDLAVEGGFQVRIFGWKRITIPGKVSVAIGPAGLVRLRQKGDGKPDPGDTLALRPL